MKLINNIDSYFYSKTQKDILMFYILLVVVIGFVFFYFLLPNAKGFYQEQVHENKAINKNLKVLIDKRTDLNKKMIHVKKAIKNLKLEKITLKKQMDFYQELANLLDFVEFNQYKWGEFVKNLVKNAKNEGLKVKGFENKVYDNDKGLINKKMDITLNVEGEYKNFLYLLYKYEDIKDLLRVENIQIDKNGNYKIKFTLYGYQK